MLKFDSALQAALTAALTKQDWCATLAAMLGSDLKIRCKRSVDASSTTIFDTGTEFFSASLTGGMQVSGGAINKFGTVSKATIRQAADLNSGASVLRIEGGGHWVEGTLGLSTSACDFKVPQSPTVKTGFGIGSLTIGAPRAMASGTGPVAPALDANAPAFIQLENWINRNAPFLVKEAPLDRRIDDYVFQDTELANEIGDVRVTQSTQTIVFGQFEFGVCMFSIHGGLNLDKPGTPVHQVVIAHKPFGTWPTYPFADTFRFDRDTTFPKAYKIKILNANRDVLKVIEMRDGLPVNDPSLSQNYGPAYTALRPHMECGQWHFWQSDRLKYSSNALKYFSGIQVQQLRPSAAKKLTAANACIPLAGAGQINSALQYYGLPEWPIRHNVTYGPDATVDIYDTFDDPYLFDLTRVHADEGKNVHISGWNVEPGSISGHDWFIGPGGPRHDRSALHTPLARYFSDPNGTRLKGNVPNRQLLDCYNHGYFHHSHHMFLNDVKNFTPMPKEWFRDGLIAFTHAYYGTSLAYVPGGATRHVELLGIPASQWWSTAPLRDGHRGLWNGWEVDQHHSYTAPGLATIFCNSPAHAVSGTLRLYAHVCGQLNQAGPAGGARSNFMTRIHAWRLLQLTVAWKMASNHPMAIDRETIEQRFQAELEATYDNVYKPAILDNSMDTDLMGVRRFGQTSLIEYGTGVNAGKKWLRATSDYKAGYFGGVFTLMRQTGCWAAMRARSPKCATVLRFLIDCMDKDTISEIYYTKGRYEAQFVHSDRVPSQGSATADLAAGLPDPVMYQDWQEWLAKNPPAGKETMVHDVNGAMAQAAKFGGGTLLRLQYALIRRDFFPDIPSPLDPDGKSIVDGAATMVQSWLDELDTKIKGISSLFSKGEADFQYGWPAQCPYNPPTVLAPL